MMPTFAPLPLIAPDAAELPGALAVAGGGVLELPLEFPEPPLPPLELHPATAIAAAAPRTARPDTVLRMGSSAFLC
jgi:hypothetical protein